MQTGEDVTLTVESLSGDGKSVARHDGMVFFIEGSVPGDTVRARIRKIRKNYAEAKTVELLKPSPMRTEPQCRHFGVCGGCRWQNLSYEAQLKFKHQIVVDAFARIGGFEGVEILPVLGCENDYFYRNKMEFTFSRRRWLTEEEMREKNEEKDEVALGLHTPGRFDKVVNLEECWLQSELSAAILRTVREVCRVWNLSVYSSKTHEGYLRHLVVRDGKRTGEVMVNIVTTSDWPEAMNNLTALLLKQFPMITTVVNNMTDRKSMVAFGDKETVYHGPGYITEKVGRYSFRISANSFFQTNPLQSERLYDIASEMAAFNRSDTVFDLYCGTGTIACFVSDAVHRVVGIELIQSAVDDARRNAEMNGISNCTFVKGDLKERLTRDAEWLNDHPKPSVVIADPPRSGMHPDIIPQLAKLSPERIVYVSCNPSTQARDARLLAGFGYVLKLVRPVDMFPHTDHCETVALLTRN